jgi:hypothetical protein
VHVRGQLQLIENKEDQKAEPWFSATSAGVFQPSPALRPNSRNASANRTRSGRNTMARRWFMHKRFTAQERQALETKGEKS